MCFLCGLFLVGCWRWSVYFSTGIAAILISSWLVCPVAFFSTFWIIALSTMLGGGHDYKEERLTTLVEEYLTELNKKNGTRSAIYDVVLLQECFGCVYSDRYRSMLAAKLKEVGYVHQVLPPCGLFNVLPSLWCNSGLAVFSRHKVVEVDFKPFKNRLFYDNYVVQRGVLAAKIAANGSQIWVASTHFGPSLDVLTLGKVLPSYIKNKLDKYEGQLSELVELVSKWRDESVEGLVCGDFNAQVNGKVYTLLKRSLSSAGTSILWDGFEAKDCPTTVNPPQDQAITGGGRTPMVLDFAFCSSGLEGSASIGDVVVDGKGWECVSDHNAIIGIVRKKEEGSRE